MLIMALTKNGICYNLIESPYKVNITYDKQVIRFYFSSKINSSKFLERLETNRDNINASLSKRFKMGVVYNILCDLTLYEKIEQRGFYITIDGKGIEWLEEIELDGTIVTRKN